MRRACRSCPARRYTRSKGSSPPALSRNREGLAGHIEIAAGVAEATEHILFDAQTSGGLLIALPPDAAEAIVARLHADHLPGAVIGHVEAGAGVRVVA